MIHVEDHAAHYCRMARVLLLLLIIIIIIIIIIIYPVFYHGTPFSATRPKRIDT